MHTLSLYLNDGKIESNQILSMQRPIFVSFAIDGGKQNVSSKATMVSPSPFFNSLIQMGFSPKKKGTFLYLTLVIMGNAPNEVVPLARARVALNTLNLDGRTKFKVPLIDKNDLKTNVATVYLFGKIFLPGQMLTPVPEVPMQQQGQAPYPQYQQMIPNTGYPQPPFSQPQQPPNMGYPPQQGQSSLPSQPPFLPPGQNPNPYAPQPGIPNPYAPMAPNVPNQFIPQYPQQMPAPDAVTPIIPLNGNPYQVPAQNTDILPSADSNDPDGTQYFF